MAHNAPVTSDVDMAIRTLWSLGRSIWADWPDMQLTQIAICLAVIEGDISRQARAHEEGDTPDLEEVGRELGGLILSAIRWMDDLGLNPHDHIWKAIATQRKHVSDV